MEKIYIDSIASLINIIAQQIRSDNKIRWFRGHSDEEWKLRPSIQRAVSEDEELEQYITNDFIMRASVALKEHPELTEYSKWITIMQHYGVPTRLLDWSQSPLYALFFAVENYNKYIEKDACIWVITPGELNQMELGYSYIYNIEHKTVEDLIFPAFKNYQRNKNRSDKIGACRPLIFDMRVYSQQSAFTVHNSKRSLEQIQNTSCLQKITIPAKFKKKLLDELKICGITLSSVYPDLEHIAIELKMKYGFPQ